MKQQDQGDFLLNKLQSRDQMLLTSSVFSESELLKQYGISGKVFEMSISIEMTLKNDEHVLNCGVGGEQVVIFVRRPDNFMSVEMTKSDMRRLARFILDEVKEEEQ